MKNKWEQYGSQWIQTPSHVHCLSLTFIRPLPLRFRSVYLREKRFIETHIKVYWWNRICFTFRKHLCSVLFSQLVITSWHQSADCIGAITDTHVSAAVKEVPRKPMTSRALWKQSHNINPYFNLTNHSIIYPALATTQTYERVVNIRFPIHIGLHFLL